MGTARVLIVDDDGMALQALSTMLATRLYRVEVATASTAEEALKRLKQCDHDVILSDIQMPGMDGLALLSELQSHYPSIPVILMSGHAEEYKMGSALNHAFAFVSKPIERGQLILWIKRALELRQLRKAITEQRVALETYAEGVDKIVAQRTRDLVDQEQFLNVLLDTVPALVVVADQDGRILVFNRTAEAFTGYSRDEVLGTSIEQFIPEPWRPIVSARLADPQLMRRPHRNPWLSKHAQPRMIEWRCQPLHTTRSDRPWVLGVGIDIEESLDKTVPASNSPFHP